MVLFEHALLWVQVQVICLQSFKYPSYELSMTFQVVFVALPRSGPRVDGYVVHIYGYTFFINEVAEYRVHHGLEGSWGVGQAEEHDCWFI